MLPPPAPLIIEDDVWIGHGVIITPGCKLIGRGAVVGAGSIVTKDVDRYSVVVGNPGEKLRDRFPRDLSDAIEASHWWELDLAAVRKLASEEPDLLFRPGAAAVRDWIKRGFK